MWCKPHRMRLVVLVLLLLMLLAGCGSGSAMGSATKNVTSHAAATPQPLLPTTLRVMRLSAFPQKRVASFEAETDQAAKVQRLFATLRALPPFVPQVSCPVDHGGAYFLTFLDHDVILAEAVIPAGDCPQVSFSKPYGCHKPTATTMDQIADTLGVTHSELSFAPFTNSSPVGSPTAPAEPSDPLLPFSPCY